MSTKLRILFIALASLCLAACSGGSSGGSGSDAGGSGSPPANGSPDPLPQTGTVGLFLTDKPSDDFAEININVTKAVLIGDNGKQNIFQGSKKINLLDLTNYNEPLAFGEVDPGNYSKIRLYIDELQLVPHDRSANIYPKLPANGKIDLLDQGGFEVVAGQTVIVEVDLDADKSIKITETGKSKKYNFRPVVKVDVMTDRMPEKLARFEGTVTELSFQPANRFVACVVGQPDNCADIRTNANTSFFDADGVPTDYSALAINSMVVAIGRYELEPNVLLRAYVVQVGGTAEQISGQVLSKPVDGRFSLLRNNGSEVLVDIQPTTRFFDANGEVGQGSVVVGRKLEIEGVFPAVANNGQPALFRAALIFVEGAEANQVSGSIIAPLDASKQSFGLSTNSGDTCVRLNSGASNVLINAMTAEVTMGTFGDLELGQAVDVYGAIASDSCIDADEVIVEVQ